MLTLSCGSGGGSCPHQHPRERARWALVAGGCWPALAQSGSSLQGKLVWGETTLEVKAGTGNSEMSMSSHPKSHLSWLEGAPRCLFCSHGILRLYLGVSLNPWASSHELIIFSSRHPPPA